MCSNVCYNKLALTRSIACPAARPKPHTHTHTHTHTDTHTHTHRHDGAAGGPEGGHCAVPADKVRHTGGRYGAAVRGGTGSLPNGRGAGRREAGAAGISCPSPADRHTAASFIWGPRLVCLSHSCVLHELAVHERQRTHPISSHPLACFGTLGFGMNCLSPSHHKPHVPNPKDFDALPSSGLHPHIHGACGAWGVGRACAFACGACGACVRFRVWGVCALLCVGRVGLSTPSLGGRGVALLLLLLPYYLSKNPTCVVYGVVSASPVACVWLPCRTRECRTAGLAW